jgi:hypothetical protein
MLFLRDLAGTAWVLLLLLFLGTGLARWAGRPAAVHGVLERLGWAWLLGTAAAGVLLMVPGALADTFTVAVLYVAAAGIWVRVRRVSVPPPVPTWRLPVLPLLLVLGLIGLDRAGGDLGWDGWAIWGAKARAIHVEGRLDTRLISDLSHYGFSHPDYPPLLPLLEASVYSHLGHVQERTVGLLVVAWLAAFAFLFRGAAIRQGGPWWGELATLLVVLAPPIWMDTCAGQADVPLLAFNVAALLLLDGPANISQIALILSGAALLKNEGMVTVLAFALAVGASALKRRAHRRELWGVLLAACALLPWAILRYRHHLVVDLFAHGLAPASTWAAHLSTLLLALVDRARSDSSLSPFIWVMVGRLILDPPRVSRASLFVVLLLTGLMVPYLLTDKDLDWLLKTSLDRVLVQVLPLLVLLPPGRRDVPNISAQGA